jgi:hypothetical protein
MPTKVYLVLPYWIETNTALKLAGFGWIFSEDKQSTEDVVFTKDASLTKGDSLTKVDSLTDNRYHTEDVHAVSASSPAPHIVRPPRLAPHSIVKTNG